jgi:nitric oxide reductase subunit C
MAGISTTEDKHAMSGTRLFFAACLVVSTALLISVTTATLRTRDTSPEVGRGIDIWRAKNCEGCHTLYGQGGPYAPDLTHIYSLRGLDYLPEFLTNPAAFHPNQRIMPVFGLTVSETDNLIAFLKWIGEQDVAAKWPPKMIVVSGAGSLDTTSSAQPSAIATDPVERGRLLFKSSPAICSTCHALQTDVIVVGPSLAGIASRAGTRVPGESAEAYIRNSILHPSDFVVPGFPDAMAKNFGSVLTVDQINDLLAFLLTLK